MQDFGCLRWVFCQIDLGLYTVVPFIPHFWTPGGSLLASQIWHVPHWTEACRTPQTREQIVSNSYLSLVKPHGMYWSIPKLPLQAINFWHCWGSGRAASSHSSIFSHFNFHFKKQWYQLSFTVQSILGPSIYGMNICCLTGLVACGLLG